MSICYFIMGVSGSGKTTVARLLSEQIQIPYYDADDFHSVANKQKMHQGIPLTDEDRAGWLQALNTLAIDKTSDTGLIIACSALKEKYRKILTQGITVPVHWVVLEGSFETIFNRMAERKDHYMPAALLRSQFEAMEYPDYGLHLKIEDAPEKIVEKILKYSI